MINQLQEEGHGLTALDRIHQVRQVSSYLAMEVTVTLATLVLMGRWEQGQNGYSDQVCIMKEERLMAMTICGLYFTI